MLKNYFSSSKQKITNLASGNNIRGILTVIGSIIIYMVFGSLYTWSNINVYLISYLKQYKSPNIEIVDGFFIMPIVIVISNLSNYFGTKLEEKIGFKKCLFLSLLITCISHFILLFTTRLSIIYFSMILFGISIGLSYIGITRNSWYSFPEKKGLVSGIILFGYGVSSTIFSGIADKIINPNNEVAEQNGFFSKLISDNTYLYIKKLNIIMLIMSIIGFLLIFDNTKINNKIVEDNYNKNENTSSIIKEVFKKRQIWQIIILNFSSLYFLYMIANTYRSFGQLIICNSELLSTLSKFYSLINGLGRIIWGFFSDKYKIKNLYFSILLSEIIISSTIFYAGKYQYLFFIMACTCSFLFSGMIVIIVLIFPKIYGIKYSNSIYSIASAISCFSCLLGPITSKVIIKCLNDYKKIYFSGLFFSLFSIINLYFVNDEKFIYSSEQIQKSLVEPSNNQSNNKIKEIEFREY